jgi:hypothetical protein
LIAIGQRIVSSSNATKYKKEMLKNILDDELYVQTIKDLDVSSMPMHWKLFFTSAKKKNYGMVYLLFKFIKILSSKV